MDDDIALLCCVVSFLSTQSLINFVNKHLNKINLEVTDLDTQVCCFIFLTFLFICFCKLMS